MIKFIREKLYLPSGLVSRYFLSFLADFVVYQPRLKNASMLEFHFASS